MATINATLTVGSSDLTSNTLALSKSMTMTKAGTNVGLEQATGLVRKTLTSTNEVDLLTQGAAPVADVTADKAAKIILYRGF